MHTKRENPSTPAFRRGFQAYGQGKKLLGNPFPWCHAWEQWRNGWLECRSRIMTLRKQLDDA